MSIQHFQMVMNDCSFLSELNATRTEAASTAAWLRPSTLQDWGDEAQIQRAPEAPAKNSPQATVHWGRWWEVPAKWATLRSGLRSIVWALYPSALPRCS